MKSIPFSTAKWMFRTSCSVGLCRRRLTSGMFMLLLLDRMPPLTTTQPISWPRISDTKSSMSPSSRSILLPGFSAWWSRGYVTETRCWSPTMSSVVTVKAAPSSRVTWSVLKVRMRISGPLVSRMVATGIRSSSLTCRTRLSRPRCSSCLPWAKLRRTALAPDKSSFLNISGLSTAGPSVQIIFVFLIMRRKPPAVFVSSHFTTKCAALTHNIVETGLRLRGL